MPKAQTPEGETIQIHLMGEIPRFGHGRRGVKMVSLGYKWVTIHYPPRRRNAKIRRELWDKLIGA